MFGALFGGALGGAMGAAMGAMTGGIVTAGDDIYYTTGLIGNLGGESFLIAYKPRTGSDGSLAALVAKMAKSDGKPPAPKPMTAETPVSLVLLNVRTIGMVSDIRPFVLTEELAAARTQAEALAEMAKDKDGGPGGGFGTPTVTFDPEPEKPKPAKTAKPTAPKKP